MGMLRDLLIGLLVVILQITIFRHLRVFGFEPDITLVLLFLWMVRYDRTKMLFLAFLIGFAQDMLLDWWGLNMFANTLTVMILHSIVPKKEDSVLGVYLFSLYLGLTVFTHQIIMLSLAQFSNVYSLGDAFFGFLIGTTVFSTVMGILVYLLSGKRF
jgi:rod shape-determining protein MreD